ncbi:ras-related protein Rab-24 [Apis mellifera caucasica]|uniref:Ras-related protein Rab-24 n=1 Tax=Apis mellifera TaxID=7460 RepID=A0A7M7TFY5_APIME|nr:ras-related protein Rab-24 [Apis mellifera]KAG6795290.1 ras-related protein Rab-24 [Apis mellifera caucasica]KAG9428712.1 ras-related protein Rab-24 [Apis mellifera carnica]|eukprot:XP_625108.2 ras-related protein Rab-24 [Apis mellifera]
MNRVDLKVVLLGNAAVGKTSLVERFVNERFNESLSYQNTIGAAFAAKQMQVNGKRLIMGIWDTAGSEKYDAMSRIYYRSAKAAVICYDITKSNTFQRAKFWVRELRSVEEGCKIYICATKNDILEHGAVPSPDISVVEAYATGIQAKFFITSSKTGENVAELFNEIAQDFVSDPNNIEKIEETIEITNESTTKATYCCH